MLETETLQVVDARLEDLRPHPRNPRRISEARLEQLQRTLTAERDMLRARPLVALPDGTVIAGNQRLAAATMLGWETIPVVYANLDDEHATRWMLLDNRSFGEDDADLAGQLLDELRVAGSDLALTGYEKGDADRLLRKFKLRDRDPDDAPPLPAEPRSKRGEVYELGAHRLMCGDATDESDVRTLFSPPHHHALDLIDAVWTDPPYGVNYVGKTKDELRIQNDEPEGLRGLLEASFAAPHRGFAPHARFYVACPPGPLQAQFLAALEGAGWRLHQGLVWVKHRIVLGHSDYHYQHEPILYGWVTDPEWPGRPGRGSHMGTRWYGDNSQASVFHADSPARSADHPTMKPVELIEHHLNNSTGDHAIVYDPFGGSGSTLIACERLGRRARMMEIDPAYCDVIRDRYATFVDGP